MSQTINYNIEKYPVRLSKNENGFFLLIHGKNVMIPPQLAEVPLNDGESVEGNLSVGVTFGVRRTQDKKLKVIRDNGEEICAGRYCFDFEGFDLGDLHAEASFYHPLGDDLFQDALCEILEGKLEAGEFDDVLYKDGDAWSYEEEQVALDIYLETLNDYSAMLALVNEYVKGGVIRRSRPAVEMKVNCYKSLDSDSEVEGLRNISSKTKEMWNQYKAGKNKQT